MMTEMHQVSRTAQYMALFRAIESGKPVGHRLFHDTMAKAFLDRRLRFASTVARIPLIGCTIPWILDTAWPGARTSGVARTRFIDDRLKQAMQEGFRQVIILGAGFDTRAYRMKELAEVSVIEVDQPATSRLKRSTLGRLLGELPSNVRFLEMDFNNQRLEAGINSLDFDPATPTAVIWEGVTNYLTAEGVEATFRSLGRIARRCRVMVTYIDRAVLDSGVHFAGAANAKARIASVGENWTFGFNPVEFPVYLARYGFHLLEDVGSREYRALYMPARRRVLRGYEWYRIGVVEK